MRPLDVVRDDRCFKLADELVAADARYGTLFAKESLEHSPTVSRKAAEVAGDLRETLRPVIKAAMEEGHCSMNVDMWTDDCKKTACITATAHNVNDDWELKSLLLFTRDFTPEQT
ncbi:hypothetical protein HPB49_003609 [Dermacentor silvarum]|uniref:Uncharacterized protein n=1 Tax=Dermacentor silvarum TaxID=543639 RepID=A0ACB8CPA8_DERSI|nr:hypothetical protein HPB49_003609 [Dermacentor silvarum]